MRSLEYQAYQLVTFHRRWKALQQHIAAAEFALEAAKMPAGGEMDMTSVAVNPATVEALQTLRGSLLIDMADLEVRLLVIVREARGRVREYWSPDGEIEELYKEFFRGPVGPTIIEMVSDSSSSEEEGEPNAGKRPRGRGEGIQERGVGGGGGGGGELRESRVPFFERRRYPRPPMGSFERGEVAVPVIRGCIFK